MKANAEYVVNIYFKDIAPARVYMFVENDQVRECCKCNDLVEWMTEVNDIVERYPPGQKFQIEGAYLVPYRMETEEETQERLNYHRDNVRKAQKKADSSWEREKRRFKKSRKKSPTA